MLKAIEAGVDQFGGEHRPELVIELVESGRLPEERVDESVCRLLKQKFELGLFDNPFVDERQVPAVLNRPAHHETAALVQRRSLTLLKNVDRTLPLTGQPRLYVKNVAAEAATAYGIVVERAAEADFAILRLSTPWYPVETKNPFARNFHHGDLNFEAEELVEILALLNKVPTIVVIYLDRPAVIPEINEAARALLAEYGASDAAVLDVIFGRNRPEGKLPFELPSSMAAVRAQKEDLPYDSENPLYAFGFGLSYE